MLPMMFNVQVMQISAPKTTPSGDECLPVWHEKQKKEEKKQKKAWLTLNRHPGATKLAQMKSRPRRKFSSDRNSRVVVAPVAERACAEFEWPCVYCERDERKAHSLSNRSGLLRRNVESNVSIYLGWAFETSRNKTFDRTQDHSLLIDMKLTIAVAETRNSCYFIQFSLLSHSACFQWTIRFPENCNSLFWQRGFLKIRYGKGCFFSKNPLCKGMFSKNPQRKGAFFAVDFLVSSSAVWAYSVFTKQT